MAPFLLEARINHGFREQLKLFDDLLQSYGSAVPQDAISADMVDGLDAGEGYIIIGSNPTSEREQSGTVKPQESPSLLPYSDWVVIALCVTIVLASVVMSLVALSVVRDSGTSLQLVEVHTISGNGASMADTLAQCQESLV